MTWVLLWCNNINVVYEDIYVMKKAFKKHRKFSVMCWFRGRVSVGG